MTDKYLNNMYRLTTETAVLLRLLVSWFEQFRPYCFWHRTLVGPPDTPDWELF